MGVQLEQVLQAFVQKFPKIARPKRKTVGRCAIRLQRLGGSARGKVARLDVGPFLGLKAQTYAEQAASPGKCRDQMRDMVEL